MASTHGMALLAWRGVVRLGRAGHRRHGKVRLGKAGPGAASQAWHGKARPGLAPQARRGAARRGLAGRGLAWHRRRGVAALATHGAGSLPLHFSFISMISYIFRKNTRIAGIDPQVAGEQLDLIYTKHNELTAPLVVDAARPEDAPLHPVFEWDDSIAAERHREHQARNLIRSVQIIPSDNELPQPVFVHVESLQSYQPAVIVVNDVDLFEEAWEHFMVRLKQSQHSLLQLLQLAEKYNPDVVEELKIAFDDLDQFQSSIASAKPPSK